MVIDLTERLQHVSASVREVGCDLDKPSPGMGETVADDHFQRLGHLGQVSSERIAHLDRGLHRGRPFQQYITKSLASMLAAREEEGNLAALVRGNNPTGEDTCTFGFVGYSI